MKTPMQELIEWIMDYDNRNLTISRCDIDRKLIELLEKEKQMIIDAYLEGAKEERTYTYLKATSVDAEHYYKETFKND